MVPFADLLRFTFLRFTIHYSLLTVHCLLFTIQALLGFFITAHRRDYKVPHNLSNMPPGGLEFTGERFIPGKSDPILALEHYHRYLFASRFAKGKRVLDVACGEGYGSALMAIGAKYVLGIDIAQDIVNHAKARYADRNNVEFMVGECENLSLPAESIDLAVSFETLEHLDAKGQESFLQGVKRSLTKEGVLILSSPEREAYGMSRPEPNEFHRCELTKEELSTLLRKFFAHVHLLGQDPVTVSLIRDTSQVKKETPSFESTDRSMFEGGKASTTPKPLYLLALCSDETLDRYSPAGISSIYFDPHSPEQALDLMAWGWKLENELRTARDLFSSLQKEFEERSVWAVSLDEKLKERETALGMLQGEFEDRTAWALSLDQERVKLELRIQELDMLRAMLDQRLNTITRSYVYRFLSFIGLVPK